MIDISCVDSDKLPTVFPSTHVVGEVTSFAAAETELAVSTPVVIGAGDGMCATIGAGCNWSIPVMKKFEG